MSRFYIIITVLSVLLLASASIKFTNAAAEENGSSTDRPAGIVRFHLLKLKNPESNKCELDLTLEASKVLGELNNNNNNNNKNDNAAVDSSSKQARNNVLRVIVGHGPSGGAAGVTTVLTSAAHAVAAEYKLPDKTREAISFLQHNKKPVNSNNNEKHQESTEIGSAILLLGAAGFTSQGAATASNTLIVDLSDSALFPSASSLRQRNVGGYFFEQTFNDADNQDVAEVKLSDTCRTRALAVVASINNALVLHVDLQLNDNTFRSVEIPARLAEVFRLALSDPEAGKLIAHATTSTTVVAPPVNETRMFQDAARAARRGQQQQASGGGGIHARAADSARAEHEEFLENQKLLKSMGRPAGLVLVTNKVEECDYRFQRDLPPALVDPKVKCEDEKHSKHRNFCEATRGTKQFYSSRVSAVRVFHQKVCKDQLIVSGGNSKFSSFISSRLASAAADTNNNKDDYDDDEQKNNKSMMTGAEFARVLQSLCEKVNAGNFPDVPTLWTSWDENLLKTVVDFVLRSYLREIEDFFYRPAREPRAVLPLFGRPASLPAAPSSSADDDTTSSGTNKKTHQQQQQQHNSLAIVAPHSLEEFEKFRSKAGGEALARSRQLLLGVLRPELIKKLEQQIDVETTRKIDQLRRATDRFVADFVDACVIEVENADEVAILPVRTAVITAWATTFPKSCHIAFDEQMTKFASLLGDTLFKKHQTTLKTDLARVVDAKRQRNADALFERAKLWLRASIRDCAAQFERNDKMKIIPAAELQAQCTSTYPSLKTFIVDRAKKNADEWILEEPLFAEMLAGAEHNLKELCEEELRKNAVRVKEVMNGFATRVIGNFEKSLMGMQFPMFAEDFEQEVRIAIENQDRIFHEQTKAFSAAETERAVQRMRTEFRNKKEHYSQQNIKEWAALVDPVKVCALNGLHFEFSSLGWMSPATYFSQPLGWIFKRKADECFASNKAGQLGFQRRDIPHNMLAPITEEWMRSTEYNAFVGKVNRNWYGVLVVVVVVVGGVFYLMPRSRR